MLTILLAALLAANPDNRPIYGVATAGDGDSLTVAGKRIRLFGIDAPEIDQICTRGGSRWACGQEAATQLSKLVTGMEVRCTPTGSDGFGRILARCTAGSVDVNRTMVALGYAVAFRKYSNQYASAEMTAKNNKRGLWSSSFALPEEFRAAETRDVPPPSRKRTSGANVSRHRASPRHEAVATACNIKGNRSRRGDWIYHVPGMPYYTQTKAEEVFCSEADARAAGYRRALVR